MDQEKQVEVETVLTCGT